MAEKKRLETEVTSNKGESLIDSGDATSMYAWSDFAAQEAAKK